MKKLLPILEKLSIDNNLKIEKYDTIFPFNYITDLINLLLKNKIITFEYYDKLKEEYLIRNKYLFLYNLSSKVFGTSWGEKHILSIVPELKKPSKFVSGSFKKEYDLFYLENLIRIEIKASRAVENIKGFSRGIFEKALSYQDLLSDKYKFWMNYQQIHPLLCDVVILIAVFTDYILYWVISSKELLENKYYKDFQHRGNKNEGQIWVSNENYKEFNQFISEEKNLLSNVILRGKK